MRRVGFSLALAALLIASSSGATKKQAELTRTHRVVAGQTPAMIAKRYQVGVDALLQANGLQRRTSIRPGQVLVIPSAEEEARIQERMATAGRTHSKILDAYARLPAHRSFVTISSYTGSFRGFALQRDGKVRKEARGAFAKVLASWRTGRQESIHDRLIQMLVKVSDHFGGRPLRIVSGFRPYSPYQYTPHSRHNLGHAADFSILGVPNGVVRDYCLSLGKVGVGYYPNSTFVHLDVRDVPTYWVDYSGPGEAPRYAGDRVDIGTIQATTRRMLHDLTPTGEYPQIRAVDPDSLDSHSSTSAVGATAPYVRGGSLETRSSGLQLPETL